MKSALVFIALSALAATVGAANGHNCPHKFGHVHHSSNGQYGNQSPTSYASSPTSSPASSTGNPSSLTSSTPSPTSNPSSPASSSSSSSTSRPSQGSPQDNGGWLQVAKGNASFTVYTNCQVPSCGRVAHGYTAAISQLTFGSSSAAGDVCGRCFKVTGNHDPYTPSFSGPFNTIVVKATDLCPYAGNELWCGQTVSHPYNNVGASVHFDLCQDSGASSAFFPKGRGALFGNYEEVPCSEWTGTDAPNDLWNGACLAGETAPLWPSTGCGNKGTPPK